MEFLTCEICHDSFDEIDKIPKLLSCGHTAACVNCQTNCARCGKKTFEVVPNYEILRCLNISHVSNHHVNALSPPSLPKPADCTRTTANLQVPKCEFCEENDAYAFCENCTKLKYLCDECFAFRHKKSPLDKHIRVPWKTQYRNPACTVHDRECLIFCKTDCKPICTLCSYGEHVGHSTCLIESEIVDSQSRLKNRLLDLERKSSDLRTVSLEANRAYVSLTGNSLLCPSQENAEGSISQLTQDIHSHFYALRHMLKQKEDELIRIVKEKSKENIEALTQQVDDVAVSIARSFILDQYINRFLSDMPNYWILENEHLIIQHISKLADGESTNTQNPIDHSLPSSELFFQYGDAKQFLDTYRIKASEKILLIKPLANLHTSSEYYVPNDDDDVSDKINDFLTDPIFSSLDSMRDSKSSSKYFEISEEEPYICYPGVAKHLTLCSIPGQRNLIGGVETFRCTLEKQEIGGNPSPTSRKLSSRRSITPPHFRHTSLSPSTQGNRTSTPPPSLRSKFNRSGSIPRTSSGSSLHSFGSHSTLSTPKKDPHESFLLSHSHPVENLATGSEEVTITDNNDGTYTLEIVTKQQGLYRLNITFGNNHIKGSPYYLHSEYHTSSIGSKGSAPGYFSSPYGVHYDQESQQLFVADSSNNRIQVFSSSGEFLSSFGTHGRSTGQFSWPLGICVCKRRIYVCDNMNNRVQVFTFDGSYVKSIGINNKQNAQLLTPYDICSSDDFIFIADSGNKRIQIHLSNGEYIRSIAFKGKQRLFSGPIGVCCGDGLLFVSDHNNNRVLAFTFEGEFVHSIGTKGSRDGELSLPHGIAYHDGQLYVSDSGNNRIQVFSKNGTFIRGIGRKGTSAGQFSFPRGISIGNGHAYVADSNNHRIQYFPVQS